jgi:peptidoglycan hydrolase-like protein with peptidoglycan-binding domain
MEPANSPVSGSLSPGMPAGSAALMEGATGERVRELQRALQRLNFPVGEIDGEYGPMTRDAVAAFQRARGLPATGIADPSTLPTLGIASGAVATRPGDLLGNFLSALMAARGASSPAAPGAPGADASVRQLLLGAFMGRPATQDATTPILSPIDKVLGGEALAGKKTALSVVAYVVLAILQAAGVVGAATPTGQILTIVIAAFGALGGVSKIDRVIQALGTVAARPRVG